jgi:hypothetical protein
VNDINLCPACLEDLPADYPFDHVAIDLALGDRPELFTAMSMDERTETVRIGLARGLTLSHLSERFRSSWAQMQLLVPADVRLPVRTDQELLDRIRELWELDLNDCEIGLRLSKAPGTVCKLRVRLELPSKFGPGGRRKKAVRA